MNKFWFLISWVQISPAEDKDVRWLVTIVSKNYNLFAWDKKTICLPHKELNPKPSDSMLWKHRIIPCISKRNREAGKLWELSLWKIIVILFWRLILHILMHSSVTQHADLLYIDVSLRFSSLTWWIKLIDSVRSSRAPQICHQLRDSKIAKNKN